ncbi:MAG: hypothetical protein FH749_06885 [Firmicutes bacterium]|nr:hypothetical protein [Bacillota bacterium]
MPKMPVLKNNDDLRILLPKLADETRELSVEVMNYQITGRIPDRDNAVKEALDVVQVAIAMLDALADQGADIESLMQEHEDKLSGRGWEFKRYIEIEWEGSG